MTLSVDDLLALERSLGEPRLGKYRRACDGTLSSAIKLYEWNADVSMLVFACIGRLEVVLRNAIDRELTELAGSAGDWFNVLAPQLSEEAKADIQKARERVVRVKRLRPTEEPSHGQVVAELSFSFWRYLVSKVYARTLWQPGLHRAFPGASVSHGVVSDTVGRVYEMRNRVAHHEPIHAWDVAERHKEIHTVLAWIDDPSSRWADGQCRARHLVDKRP